MGGNDVATTRRILVKVELSKYFSFSLVAAPYVQYCTVLYSTVLYSTLL